MGRRRDSRIVVSIPVRVIGTDYDGNPFKQTAQTIDVSRTGARLSGVRCFRGPGEMVTIECGSQSARFLVVWLGQPGTSEDGMFGVRALQPEKRIFRIDVNQSLPDGYQVPTAQPSAEPFDPRPTPGNQWDHSERRGSRRIRCAGTAQIRQQGVSFPIWAKLVDISMGGCYMEMVFTIPRGSAVDIQLTINTRNLTARGKVVTSHPGVGVGIRFTEIATEGLMVLAEILQELTGGTSRRARTMDSQPPPTS